MLTTDELMTVLSTSEAELEVSVSTAELVTVGEDVAPDPVEELEITSGSTDELETVVLSGTMEDDAVPEAVEVAERSPVELAASTEDEVL